MIQDIQGYPEAAFCCGHITLYRIYTPQVVARDFAITVDKLDVQASFQVLTLFFAKDELVSLDR